MQNFVHLRVHTEYSLVDSVVRVPALMKATAAAGMGAIGLTDECNLFALVKFYRAALAAGVKPVIGVDLWLAEGERQPPSRLTLLCQSHTGYLNLSRLVSRAYLEGERQNTPLIARQWLTREALEGMIALSGGWEGDVGHALLTGRPAQARRLLKGWQDLLGDRYYIELQRLGRTTDAEYVAAAVQLAAEADVPVVATNDVRFLAADDHEAHEARVCIRERTLLADANRRRRYTREQYLRTPAEMAELFADIPAALANTVEIARRCSLPMQLGHSRLPVFPTPDGSSADDYIRTAATEGLAARLQATELQGITREDYAARLERELGVIISMGFAGYFLIVADFIRWARENGVPVGPGRGSGAGSLVAWVLGITDLDPLEHQLLFERFLNPERVSMPDFDVDFCMEGRDRVIAYVAERYGRERVSQIITYGTMAAKAVVRDVARVLGHPFGFADRIAKLIPNELDITLDAALKKEPELARLNRDDEEVRGLLELAMKLEGITRNAGKHAGGVVIAPSVLTDFTPLYTENAGEGVVTQFDKDDVEAAGLVKFDFLGLRTLTIIDRAEKIVNALPERAGNPLSMARMPMDDPATYELLKSGETTAVFQLESRGMKDLIRRLKPDSFEDVVALVALFRPGPLQSGMVDDFIARKHDRSGASVDYLHPSLQPVLEPTYGVILYQEQVMQIAQVLSGYTLGGADLLRRAMGKKKKEEMAKHRSIFRAGAAKKGVDEKTAGEVFDMMEKFAGYGFNKSHSAAYSLVAYHTAYLKAHYPAEFMAACLTNEAGDSKKLAVALDEARRMGLELLPPCVNASERHFTVEGSGADRRIRYGLYAVKTVGANAIEAIVGERKKRGPFESLFDFCRRVDLHAVNKTALEALTRAGAFDFCEAHRAQLAHAAEDAFRFGQQHQVNKALGQNSLFGGDGAAQDDFEPSLPHVEPWTRGELLRHEKELMGFYVSGHPLDAYEAEVRAFVTAYLGRPDAIDLEREQRVCGIVTEVKQITTKAGKPMAFLTLEDQTGQGEVVLFTSVFERHSHLLTPDEVVMVRGQAEVRGGAVKLKATAIDPMWKVREQYVKRIVLRLNADDTAEEAMLEFFGLCQRNKGPVQLLFDVETREIPKPVRLRAQKGMVEPTSELMQGMYRLFGREMVMLEGEA